MTESLMTGNTPSTGEAAPADTTPAPATGEMPAATMQQAPEGQTAAPEGAAAGTEGEQATPEFKILGAPEAYEFTPPEGSNFDNEVIGELSSVAKELDLSQGAAQKLVDRLAPKIAERAAVAQQQAIDALQTEWRNMSSADKEFGGEKLNENLAVADKALNTYGTPELRALMKAFDPVKNPTGMGLGNNPEIIRAFYRAGLNLNEDKFVPGGTRPVAATRDPATALYGNKH